jgi:HK97 family phage major capsid protein
MLTQTDFNVSPLIGMSDRDIARYSIARVLRCMVARETDQLDGVEGEASRELEKKAPQFRRGGGIGIPFDVFQPKTRDMQATVFGSGGAFVATTVDPTPIPLLRNKLCAIRLGATVLSGLTSNVTIPRQTSPSTAEALPEIGAVTPSTLGTDQVALTPHRISAQLLYSRQLLFQSSPSLEIWLRKDLAAQIAIQIDRYVWNGQGAGDEPLGILNTPGVGSIIFGGTATWQSVLNFEQAIAAANADIPGAKMAFCTSPAVRNRWKAVAKTGLNVTTTVPIFLWEPSNFADDSGDGVCNGYRSAVTNQIPNNAVIFGNFEEILIGIFGNGLEMVLDPYTAAGAGEVKMTAISYVDIGLRHPQSLVVSADSGAQ